MKNNMETVQQYLDHLPEDRKEAMQHLRQTLLENLPDGFTETISYGMIGFVVPHSLYPKGYHCDTKLPLPFLSIASQKNFIALYHMGIYSSPELLSWFTEEFPKYSKQKLDMGKSCIRFKKPEQIPYELIGLLAQKMSPSDWITIYEKALDRK